MAQELPAQTDEPSFARQAFMVFLLATLVGAFWQVNPGFLDTADGDSVFVWQRSVGVMPGDTPYHIRMGYMYRTGELFEAGPDFHWTRLSVWNGNFSDKDFLYHLYLIPFTFFAQDEYDHGGLLQGAKISSAVACGLLALAVLTSLRMLGVRRAWPFVVLLAALSATFVLRTCETRSWFMAAGFSVLGWAAIARGRAGLTFVIGVLYTLSYTAAHVLIALAVFQLLGRLVLGPEAGGSRRADLRRNAITLGMAVLGIVAGWALHPQPIELLKLWWVQNVLVVLMHSGGEVTGTIGQFTQQILGWEQMPPDLHLPAQLFGAELLPMTAERLFTGFGGVMVLPLAVIGLAFAARWRPTREHILTMALAVMLVALLPRSVRFSEYAVPFAILAAGTWLASMVHGARAQAWLARPRLRRAIVAAGGGVLALGITLNGIYLHRELQFLPPSYYPEMVTWLESHDEVRGKLIYNLAWDSFPELFVVRSDCDYAAGLDPAFVVAAGTRQSQVFVHLALGNINNVASGGYDLVRVLRRHVGADYVFVVRRVNPVMYQGCKELAQAGLLVTEVQDEEIGYAMYRVPPAP